MGIQYTHHLQKVNIDVWKMLGKKAEAAELKKKKEKEKQDKQGGYGN